MKKLRFLGFAIVAIALIVSCPGTSGTPKASENTGGKVQPTPTPAPQPAPAPGESGNTSPDGNTPLGGTKDLSTEDVKTVVDKINQMFEGLGVKVTDSSSDTPVTKEITPNQLKERFKFTNNPKLADSFLTKFIKAALEALKFDDIPAVPDGAKAIEKLGLDLKLVDSTPGQPIKKDTTREQLKARFTVEGDATAFDYFVAYVKEYLNGNDSTNIPSL
uniref:VpsA n=1 Tax=Treponema phagedenis TaxID=162 RepID=A0A191VM23_TREPH|nr:VpsA [Treponema phagedenis]